MIAYVPYLLSHWSNCFPLVLCSNVSFVSFFNTRWRPGSAWEVIAILVTSSNLTVTAKSHGNVLLSYWINWSAGQRMYNLMTDFRWPCDKTSHPVPAWICIDNALTCSLCTPAKCYQTGICTNIYWHYYLYPGIHQINPTIHAHSEFSFVLRWLCSWIL